MCMFHGQNAFKQRCFGCFTLSLFLSISLYFCLFLTIRFVVHFYFVCVWLFSIFAVCFYCNKCYFIVCTLLYIIVTLQQI